MFVKFLEEALGKLFITKLGCDSSACTSFKAKFADMPMYAEQA